MSKLKKWVRSLKKSPAIIRRWLGFETVEEKFQDEVTRWFRDRGDTTLRLNYPLTSESLVLDLGGYKGDFAAAIHERHGCQVFLFEPFRPFYEECCRRFKGNPKIRCFNFGLSDVSGQFEISEGGDGTSFVRERSAGNERLSSELRSVTQVFDELGIQAVDLMKINIEGGEFDLLPALIDSGYHEKIKFIQVQFHTFVPQAKSKRKRIREGLNQSHKETWNYEFVWENWSKKTRGDTCSSYRK